MAEEWTRANPLQQQRADRVLSQVIAWVEDGQRPKRGKLPEGDPELLTYYGLFGKLRIDAHRGLIKRFADQEVCRSRGLQIRWVADQMGCRSGGLQIKRVAGQWRLRTGVHDAGKEGFRKVGCRQRIYIYKKYKATSPHLHTGDFLPVLQSRSLEPEPLEPPLLGRLHCRS